jgi:hypothetical protein
MGNFDGHDDFDYSGALGRALEADISVTFYYGKTDTACNYVGGYAMANGTIDSTIPRFYVVLCRMFGGVDRKGGVT